MTVFLDAKYVAVGSPTLNSQMLPTVAEFVTYMKGLSPKNEGRVGIPFGSYGWAPLGPKNISAELEGIGFDLPLGTIARNWLPDDAYLEGVRQQVIDLVK
jgi:flavorubredoxin